MRAAVDAAENWGTYVMVHAYTDRSVQQALRAGVWCIEHGQLLSEQTVAMMAEHGRWPAFLPPLAGLVVVTEDRNVLSSASALPSADARRISHCNASFWPWQSPIQEANTKICGANLCAKLQWDET